MTQKAFSPQLLDQLKTQVLAAIQSQPGPHYAAFDADGTLWNSDLGEQFFQYQIDHCQLSSLQNVDPWHYYESTKSVDPVKAYLWLAQISAGLPLSQVRQWAKQAVEKNPPDLLLAQKQFISWLQEQGVKVLIVTASIQWAVEPAGQLMGVAFEDVIGIQTKIDENGNITSEQKGVITWRDGKATALLERTGGKAPVFCSGNTFGDIALIETSVGGKLCIQTQNEENSLFEEERKLRVHAAEKGWPVHNFYL